MSAASTIMSCCSNTPHVCQQLLVDIRTSIVVPSGGGVPSEGIPGHYVAWIDSMLSEGTVVFQIYAILAHMQFDESFRSRMFLHEHRPPAATVEFMEVLQDKLNDALLGRKPYGSSYSAAEVASGRFKRVASIVSSMQDMYMAM